MKHFSASCPMVEFPVRCPQDGGIHQAVAHAFCPPNEPPVLTLVECHRSWECAACKECLNCISLAFASDQEPDRFRSPLDPRLLPAWKA